MIENDIILRQPVELSPFADTHRDPLLRLASIGLVPLGRPRRGDDSVRICADIDINSKPIPTRDSAGRVHDHRMTDTVSFRIKRSLNPQRPVVQPMLERSPLAMLDEPKFKARAP